MLINLLGKVPRKLTVAVSGGVDSMVLLDFLSRNHDITAAFYHHGTTNSELAYKFLVKECNIRDIPLEIGHLQESKPKDQSEEEFWRISRYKFLDQFECVATAHTLDDAVETWIWSSMHGCSKLLPYRRGVVIRPLLLTTKQSLHDWAARKGVQWQEDASNKNLRYTRNYIRHEIVPRAKIVNPGIYTVIKRKLEQRGTENLDEQVVDR
jgi:tRNA(Ile)-lysidine synthase